ncbi:MAG: bacillithiol biosynthesis cysteine-adding enzyme BshC [Bacteroidota bacterium]
MKVDNRAFDGLPFSKLFKDYISGTGNIHAFFQASPTIKGISDSLNSYRFTGNREVTHQMLSHYNDEFLENSKVFSQVEAFSNQDTVAIVTGQQTTLFGGPMFTVLKTITAICYAKKLQEETGRTVVPVFWLADEDHDIEEIATVKLPESYETKPVTFQHQDYKNAPPAGSIQLGNELHNVLDVLKKELDQTDFYDELISTIEQAYNRESTFTEAFGRLMMSMFSRHGLILAGSLNKDVKKSASILFKHSVTSAPSLTNALDNTTYRLKEEGYHDQVQVQSSNLFYVSEGGGRIKIQNTEGKWNIPGKIWSEKELLDEIDDQPERFSPNVFLRPLLQDRILPVAGYVGGPGEIAYYAQMKEFYNELQQPMPAIIPRFSATIFESAIERIIQKLPFNWAYYIERIEDLEKEYVEQSDSADIEKIFGIWRSQIDELSRAKRQEIGEIDPSLKGSVGKAKATYFSELDKLKGKVYRSVKEQEQVQIDRIRRIKNNLFPNGSLQEREVGFIYFMNKYGMDIWDTLLDQLHEEDPFSHKEVHL